MSIPLNSGDSGGTMQWEFRGSSGDAVRLRLQPGSPAERGNCGICTQSAALGRTQHETRADYPASASVAGRPSCVGGRTTPGNTGSVPRFPEAKPACGGGSPPRRAGEACRHAGNAKPVAPVLSRFSPSGRPRGRPPLLAAGKTMTRVSRYATLPSCPARHDETRRAGTDLEAAQ